METYAPYKVDHSPLSKSGLAQIDFQAQIDLQAQIEFQAISAAVLVAYHADFQAVRSHEERRCSILGPPQSRISPSILWYMKKRKAGSPVGGS